MPSAQDTFVTIVGNTLIALAIYLYCVVDADRAPRSADPADEPVPYITLEIRDRPVDIDFSRGDCVISVPGDCRFQ